MHVNLLPSSFTMRRLVSKRLRQWGWMFGLLVVVGVGLNISLLGNWWAKNRDLREALAVAEPIRDMQASQIQLEAQLTELKKRITQVKSVLSPDRTCSVLGIIAQGVRSSGKSIQIQESQFFINTKTREPPKTTQVSQRTSAPQPGGPKDQVEVFTEYQLTLRGIAAEGESITEFVKSIQQSSAFPSVELRSSHERTVSERLLQEFQLECISHE